MLNSPNNASAASNALAATDPVTPRDPQAAAAPTPTARELKQERFRRAVAERNKETKTYLAGFLNNEAEKVKREDAAPRRAANQEIATFMQYFDGKEYGGFAESGEWRDDQETNQELAYSLLLVPAHVGSAKTLLEKTEIIYEYEAKNPDAVTDTQLAEMCEKLGEEEMERIFTDDLRGDEYLNILLAGKSYREHFSAPDPVNPAFADVPTYSLETFRLPGARICANEECGALAGVLDDECVRCGSKKFLETSGGTSLKSSTGSKKITLSVNQMRVPSPLAVQHDVSARKIETSSVFVERDSLRRAEAEYLYNQVLPQGQGKLSDSTVMIRELERSRVKSGLGAGGDAAIISGAFAGESGGDIIERERIWLAPWRYSNFIISEDNWYFDKAEGLLQVGTSEPSPKGAKKIKPGTRLGDVFPGGLFYCVVDGTNVEINSGRISDRWVKLIFGQRPAHADGAGLMRMRVLADMANDATNLEMKILMDDANPQTFIDRKFLSYLARVGEYNLLDNLGEKTPAQAVMRLPGSAAHPALGVMNERVQASAQFLNGTFSSMGAGAPDIRAAGTATGVAAMTEEAVGRFLEAIRQIKRADIQSRFIVLNNIKRNYNKFQIDRLKERFGANVVTRFLAANLREAVIIRVKKGTDQPKSKALKVAMMQAFGQAAAQFSQLPQGAQILESLSESMDFSLTTGFGLEDKKEATRRIALMREQAKVFSEKHLPPQLAEMEAIKLLIEIYSSVENEVVIGEIAGMFPQMQTAPMPPQNLPQRPIPQMADGAPIGLPSAEPDTSPAMPSPGMPPLPGQMPGQMPPPAPAEPEATSVVMMQEHEIFMDACKDFVFGEGANMNNDVLNKAVSLMWKLHDSRSELKKQEVARRQAKAQTAAQKVMAEFAKENAPPPPPAPPQPSPEDVQSADEQATQKEIVAQMAQHEASKDLLTHKADLADKGKDEDLRREMIKKDAESDRSKHMEQHRSKLRDDYPDGRE